jgi:sigma-B regulation protein RsbU (phosphoserine phosphatase)
MGEIENNGHLFYVNAGHPPPFLVHGDQIYDLGPTGIVLGYLKDIELHRSYIGLEPGSILVLYSDGIVERGNSSEEEFGVDRLKHLVYDNQNLNARELVLLIFDTVFKFGNSINWEDDATLVVVKRQV